MMPRHILQVVSVVLAIALTHAALAASQRPMTVNDLFELESVGRYYGGPWAFSPDGQQLAYVRVRPKKTLTNHEWGLWGNAGGDVWVQNELGAVPKNITMGKVDGSGWWAPEWSPDGRWLAMLSTRGGNVTLWVWDSKTGKLKQLSRLGVDASRIRRRPYVWLDADHLLYPALPKGKRPLQMIIKLQTPKIACQEWPKAALGHIPTASVLNSGVSGTPNTHRRGSLLRIDVVNDATSVVSADNTESWQVSPTGDAVAFARQTSVYRPVAGQALPFLGHFKKFCVGVAAIDGTPIKLHGNSSCDIFPGSLRWSPDGRELAFLGYSGTRRDPPSLYLVDITDRTVKRVPLGRLDVSPAPWQQAQLEWVGPGEWMVYGARNNGTGKLSATARRDWWRIDAAGGGQHLLTGALKTPPETWWPEQGRHVFVALIDGDIWSLRPETGQVKNLTKHFQPAIDEISWPTHESFGTGQFAVTGKTYTRIFFMTRDGDHHSYYRLNLESGDVRAVNLPSLTADLVAQAPTGGDLVFYQNDRDGLDVWRTNSTGNEAQALFRANQFLRGIAEGQFKLIKYTSLNGKALKAWVILPVGYRPGTRYPLLVWVYPGSVAGPRPPAIDRLGSSNTFNMQIAAAHGYAVLLPSMPLPANGIPSYPELRLSDGVLPAVTRLVELGIADPNRLFLAGHSFGGYATYGLITQTSRFKAAVALAGLSDLYSLWGQFNVNESYTDDPELDTFEQQQAASIVGAYAPPWQNLGRYLLNSPIFYVNRVKTPLMIIQGDLDYVAIQQGEEFFTSLYRQGKRAQFVRYWGEGHVLQSPANIRDAWHRMFEWFDEFSPKPTKTRE